MTSQDSTDAVQRAEEALVAAEEALQQVEGEIQPQGRNISVSNGVIHGRLVRVVSIISEKNARQ